jgi:hypothetical protein
MKTTSRPLGVRVWGAASLLLVTGPLFARELPPAAGSFVALAYQKSAAEVVKVEPTLAMPAKEVIVAQAAEEFHTPDTAKANRESVQNRLRASDLPITPENAGSPSKYLRKKPTLRGFAELFNPLAPVEHPEAPAALAFETRRPLSVGYPTRLRDECIVHEPLLRIW